MSIGAASIVAKVYRDRLMETYDAAYPGYGFGANKGYGSAEHIAAIQELGLTPIHRRSFVKNLRPQEGDTTTDKGGRGETLAAKQSRKWAMRFWNGIFMRSGARLILLRRKRTQSCLRK